MAAFASALGAPPAYVALRALALPTWVVAPVVAAGAITAARVLASRLPASVEDLLASRARLVAWSVVAVVLVAQTARLSVFMLDGSRRAWAVVPQDASYVDHSCYAAYYEAARLARDVSNVYDPALVFTRSGPRRIGSFNVDLYEYPPPFLLLFRAAQALGGDFFRVRTLWYSVDFAVVALALALLAHHVGGKQGVAAALLAPAALFTLPIQTTLQIGNFQLAALALAVLAMVSFDRGRPAAGGALLAYVTLSKVFPGILLVVLLAQKRWRAIAWTVAWSAAMIALTLAVFGVAPFRAFIAYQLPRIATGEAFPFLETFPPAVALNHSVPGVVLKLRLAGVSWATAELASVVGWAYTALVVALAWRRGAATRSRLATAECWIALVWMAALRSPFLPDVYATFGTLWLLSLILVERPRGPGAMACFIAAWVFLNIYYPSGIQQPVAVMMPITLLPQVVTFATLAVVMAAREPDGLPALRPS